MHRLLRSWVVSVFSICLLGLSPSLAQPDDEKSRALETLEYGQREAGRYLIQFSQGGSKPFAWKAESILKWHNTVNKSVHGNIFVWTQQGRPEVIGSIFQFYQPKREFMAEFQSLSLSPLVARKDQEIVWSPKDAGLSLQPFDEGIVPADSKPQRLRQMRQLADKFDAEMTDYNGESYRLRLMPQPLYRYESTDPDLLDGALFSYTYTTDPELLVAVEARKTGDEFRWVFGLARMNSGIVKASYKDREVFRVEQIKRYAEMDDGYTIFVELPLPVLEGKDE